MRELDNKLDGCRRPRPSASLCADGDHVPFPVAKIERYVELSPLHVWGTIISLQHWYVRPIGFGPHIGNRFRVGHLPLLGTGYTGVHEGRVTRAVPAKALEFTMSTFRDMGSSTQWCIASELAGYRNGTRIAVTIGDLDLANRHQRALLYCLTKVIEQSLDFGDARALRGLPCPS